jgi:hypothetical protein
MWAERLLMAAPFIESWNREVGWKNALRRAEMPAADGLIAGKWLSCCYKLQLPCAHCTSALVSRLSTVHSMFCTIDVPLAPDVDDCLSAVLSHIATCHRFTFLVFDLAGPSRFRPRRTMRPGRAWLLLRASAGPRRNRQRRSLSSPKRRASLRERGWCRGRS